MFTRKADYERFVALLYACNRTESVRLDNGSGLQGRTLLKYVLSQPKKDGLVDICAYCIMPNHFHLLLREQVEGGISKFMQKLITGYTMYFNKRYDRTGVLFQGKYKAVHADTDTYLKYLLAYIHLNPVKLFDPGRQPKTAASRKDLGERLEKYAYSSYPDYLLNERDEGLILNKEAFPAFFESPASLRRDMAEWIELAKEI